MRLRTLVLALVAAVGAFLGVGVGVIELTPEIEFSIFLALPIGLVAAVVAAMLVILVVGSPSRGRQRVLMILSAFGIGFIGVVVTGVGIGSGFTVALLAGGVAGIILAGIVWGLLARQRRQPLSVD